MQVLQDAALVLLALTGMEGVAWATHRYLMHGPLWMLHRSHHEPRLGRFELNDLFALYFALPAMAMIFWGRHGWPPAQWLGCGMTAYGVVYALFHDGLVHNRFRSPLPLRLMKRLVQAHRLHHAVATRTGAVSYGFLWAPPVRLLKARLRAIQAQAVVTPAVAPEEPPIQVAPARAA